MEEVQELLSQEVILKFNQANDLCPSDTRAKKEQEKGGRGRSWWFRKRDGNLETNGRDGRVREELLPSGEPGPGPLSLGPALVGRCRGTSWWCPVSEGKT